MNIRRLVPGDAPAYRALMLHAYAAHPDAYTSGADERAVLPLAWWQARLEEAPEAANIVLGAFHGDALVGVAGLSFASRQKIRHKATLFGMYVSDAARRGGIGTELVRAALAAARARPGVTLVQLTVTQGNRAAQSLYERCGFLPYGIEPFAVAIDDGFVAKLHMWLALPAITARAAKT